MKKKYFFIPLLLIVLFILMPFSSLFSQGSSFLNIRNVDTDKYPSIKIYFTLFDSNGAFIKNLNKSDIEVKENNTSVKVFSVNYEKNVNIPIYITLLFDNSGSMKGKPLEEAKEAAINFISKLNSVDEVKIYEFNDKPIVLADFTNDKNTLKKTIESINVAGSKTALNLTAYNASKDLQAKPLGQRVIILFTDGLDDDESILQDDAINLAKDLNIPIYSIGIGSKFDQSSKNFSEPATEALSRFSILTNGVFYIAIKTGELENKLAEISQLLKQQYVIEFKSFLPKDGKLYELEIRTKFSNENLTDKGMITTPTFKVTVMLDTIKEGQEIVSGLEITPKIIIDAPFETEEEIKKVKYFVDNSSEPVYQTDTYPFKFNFVTLGYRPGEHNLTVKVYDSIGREFQDSKKIILPAEQKRISNKIIIIISVAAVFLIGLIILLIFIFKRNSNQKTVNKKRKQIDFSKTMITKDSNIIPAIITIQKGSSKGKNYFIPLIDDPGKRNISVGRTPDNDIILTDPSVSKYHFNLILDKSGCFIEDTKSTNGTFVNGNMVSARILLNNDDKIVVGDSELLFKYLKPNETLTLGINKTTRI